MIRIARSRFFVEPNPVVKQETSLKMKFAYLIFSVYSTNLQNSALSETCRHVKNFILRYRPFFRVKSLLCRPYYGYWNNLRLPKNMSVIYSVSQWESRDRGRSEEIRSINSFKSRGVRLTFSPYNAPTTALRRFSTKVRNSS